MTQGQAWGGCWGADSPRTAPKPPAHRPMPHSPTAALQQGQPHAVPQPQQSWSRRITGMEGIPPQPGPPSGLLRHQDLAPSSTRCTIGAGHQRQDGALGRGTPTPAAVAGQSLGGDVPRVLPLSTASTSQPWHTGPGTRLTQCQHQPRTPSPLAPPSCCCSGISGSRGNGRASPAPFFLGVRGQVVLGSAVWLQPPQSLSQASIFQGAWLFCNNQQQR